MTAGAPSDDRAPGGGSTSRSLLAEAKLADPAAWERLAKLYAPLVVSWCHGWGVPGQDVIDVLQEVFSAVARHLDGFRKERPEDTFRGWLLTIARNKTRDYFRRRAREPAAVGGTEAAMRLQQLLDPHVPGEANETADVLPEGLLRTALESIRGEFHEKTWRAFWGVAVEGRAAGDVAADLAMQPGAVRVAKSRVLLRLRRELGDSVE
ncbi:MAG: RNA polymerase sigma factor [Deltaproteobacteria bacterium]